MYSSTAPAPLGRPAGGGVQAWTAQRRSAYSTERATVVAVDAAIKSGPIFSRGTRSVAFVARVVSLTATIERLCVPLAPWRVGSARRRALSVRGNVPLKGLYPRDSESRSADCSLLTRCAILAETRERPPQWSLDYTERAHGRRRGRKRGGTNPYSAVAQPGWVGLGIELMQSTRLPGTRKGAP